jgi:hypothetical protein
MADHEKSRSELLLELIAEALLCSRVDRHVEELYKDAQQAKEEGHADLSDKLLRRAGIHRYALTIFEERVEI